MDEINDGAGADTPAQDRALRSLAALFEEIGDEAVCAFAGNDDTAFADCTRRAEAVVRLVVALPAVTLQGAAAKADVARATSATVLLEPSLVDALATDMHADIVRLRVATEGAGHA